MYNPNRTIIVEPYNPEWKNEFEKIKDMLMPHISDIIIGIEHVGSTSVEGLSAKPIIDFNIIIESYDIFPELVNRLEALGYSHEGDLGIKAREAFKRNFKNEFMDYHMYVCPKNSRELARHIVFRDYLRKYKTAADEYGKLKIQLAEKYRHDIDLYIEGKHDFLEDILRKAEKEKSKLKMTYPKMIIFDYGHTLMCELGFNGVKGTEAVMKYAVYNKNNLTPIQDSEFSANFFSKLRPIARTNALEFHNHKFQRMLYEYLEIDIPLEPDEIEQIFWDNAAPGEKMSDIDKVISYINENKIRSGVISNISFSGDSLAERINKNFPNNKFEFIIASSEYIVRKPDPMIFELAIKKANLKPEEIWFCGDNVYYDIAGANSAGMFPVWYDSNIECYYRDKYTDTIDYNHQHIKNWTEIIDVLEGLK